MVTPLVQETVRYPGAIVAEAIVQVTLAATKPEPVFGPHGYMSAYEPTDWRKMGER